MFLPLTAPRYLREALWQFLHRSLSFYANRLFPHLATKDLPSWVAGPCLRAQSGAGVRRPLAPEVDEEDERAGDEAECGHEAPLRARRGGTVARLWRRQLAVEVRGVVQPVPRPPLRSLHGEPPDHQRDDAARGPVARVADEQRVQQEDAVGPLRVVQTRGGVPIEEHGARCEDHQPGLEEEEGVAAEREWGDDLRHVQ
eukprot:gene17385-biopygen1286